MKRFVYFIILAMSLTFVFSQGKPCCKNKVCKGKVSCKVNQANIDVKGDGSINDDGSQATSNISVQSPNNATTNSSFQKKCGSCGNSPWWKFWVKKSIKDCPCKLTDATEEDVAG